MKPIILSTSDSVYGKKITKHLGVVRGTSIRARHIGHDLTAFFRSLVGGEIHEYTKLMAESREQVLDRLMDDARELGANAVVAIRFTSTEVSRGAAELMAYGTAVFVEDLEPVESEN